MKRMILVGCLLLILFLDCKCPFEPEGTGTLVITSTPSGARIYLEFQNTEVVTPHTFYDLKPGMRHINLCSRLYKYWWGSAEIKSKETSTVHANLTPICTRDTVGNLSLPPEIKIVSIDAERNVKGIANNIDTGIQFVILWACTDMCYIQPAVALEPIIEYPYICINSDGTWESWTHMGQVIALIVDTTYIPGRISQDPKSAPGVLAWAWGVYRPR